MILTLCLSLVFVIETAFDLCFDLRIVLLGTVGKELAYAYYRGILFSPHVVLLNTLAIPLAHRESLLVLAVGPPSNLVPSFFGRMAHGAALALHTIWGSWGWMPPKKLTPSLWALNMNILGLNILNSFSYLVILIVFYWPIIQAPRLNESLFDWWWFVLLFRGISLLSFVHHVIGCTGALLAEIASGRRKD
eukprot:TRINITY_DN3066_c0_g1_i1.p1 TRINITY_DN3066_c0_g1~~TRINITY_DN3066_c0_g1_i1.p1  ORF type:complete len:191 (+),score=20.33 TRINITY_DN3066_c0_g1_i1:71-643(+)